MRVEDSAQHVAERGADWNGAVEDRHDPAKPLDRKIVRQNRRRDRSVCRFPDADRRAGDEQHRKRRNQPAGRRCDTPERHAERDQTEAGHAVAERAEDGRGERIKQQKGRHQRPQARVARMPHRRIASQALEQGRHDEPIDVVEQIDERKDDQSAPGK